MTYTAKKEDPEETVEKAFAYSTKVLNQYRNCYVPDRLVKKFKKADILAFVSRNFPDRDITLDECAQGGYVLNSLQKK